MAIRPWYSRWYGIVTLYISFAIVVFGLRSFAYEPFRMPSASMFPTIPVGSYLVVEKFGYGHYGTYDLTLWRSKMSRPIKSGDIIAFDMPEDESIQYVKRVIGLPGDTLQIKDHQLMLNGIPVINEDAASITSGKGRYEQAYNIRSETLNEARYSVAFVDGAHSIELIVPPHSYFVMGDNRDNSRDSRHWGFVPEENIVGKVV